jgi:hypothetical protein
MNLPVAIFLSDKEGHVGHILDSSVDPRTVIEFLERSFKRLEEGRFRFLQFRSGFFFVSFCHCPEERKTMTMRHDDGERLSRLRAQP